MNTESALVAPLSAHLGIKVSYAVRYDSRPPVTLGTTDRVLTTGVQVAYSGRARELQIPGARRPEAPDPERTRLT